MFFLFLMVLLSSSLYAQNQNVLVVPYTRFQFISEFSIEEIATQNNVSSDEVFSTYQNALKEAFSSSKNNQFTFIPIEQEAYDESKKFIRYNIDKFKGRKYNASNLSLLTDDVFNALLKKHNATHILFVNWYNISKSVHTVYVGDRNKRAKYSTHRIDYDVYNNKKVRVLGKGNVPLQCGDFPSESIINHKSLNASELTICYKDLIDELVDDLNSLSTE